MQQLIFNAKALAAFMLAMTSLLTHIPVTSSDSAPKSPSMEQQSKSPGKENGCNCLCIDLYVTVCVCGGEGGEGNDGVCVCVLRGMDL